MGSYVIVCSRVVVLLRETARFIPHVLDRCLAILPTYSLVFWAKFASKTRETDILAQILSTNAYFSSLMSAVAAQSSLIFFASLRRTISSLPIFFFLALFSKVCVILIISGRRVDFEGLNGLVPSPNRPKSPACSSSSDSVCDPSCDQSQLCDPV